MDWAFLARLASEIAVVIVIPLLVANVRVLLKLSRMVQQHHQTLYGPTGENGHRADILRLRDRTHDLANGLNEQGVKLALHEDRIKRTEGDVRVLNAKVA